MFLKMLSDLRSFRVQAKALARELKGAERRNLEALQQTFKILINSFYGYLGFSLGPFQRFRRRQRRDPARPRSDPARGGGTGSARRPGDRSRYRRNLLRGALRAAPTSAARSAARQIAAAMPDGIRLEIDGRYPAMFSYKMKNYVLLDERGEMTIRGSGLKFARAGAFPAPLHGGDVPPAAGGSAR